MSAAGQRDEAGLRSFCKRAIAKADGRLKLALADAAAPAIAAAPTPGTDTGALGLLVGAITKTQHNVHVDLKAKISVSNFMAPLFAHAVVCIRFAFRQSLSHNCPHVCSPRVKLRTNWPPCATRPLNLTRSRSLLSTSMWTCSCQHGQQGLASNRASVVCDALSCGFYHSDKQRGVQDRTENGIHQMVGGAAVLWIGSSSH